MLDYIRKLRQHWPSRNDRGMAGNSMLLQMQAIFDNSPDALLLADHHTGRILRINKRTAELFETGDFMIETIGDFCSRYQKEPVSHVEMAFVQDSLNNTGEWESEVEFVSGNNKHFWGAVSLRVINMDGKRYQSMRVTDITGRVRMAEQLKKSEAQLAEAQRLVSLGNWHHNYVTGETIWSEEIFRQYGLDPLGPIPSSEELFARYIHPDDRQKVQESVAKALQQGYTKFDHRVVRADGGPRHLEVIAKRVVGENGEVTMLYGTIRDVTEKMLAEEVQRRSEEQVKASLREKELLLAEVHHRVKNNLAVISGLLGLQANYVQDEHAKELFNESRSRIRSMAMIHDRLYSHDTVSNIDFGEYISDLVCHIRGSYDASNTNIRFHLSCSDARIDIRSAVPCGLILNELVSNAYKHAFRGRESGEIKILFARESDRFRLEVSDNGIGYHPGMEPKDITSLGLTLVTSLVEQLEGSLEMKNTVGTSFIITFKG